MSDAEKDIVERAELKRMQLDCGTPNLPTQSTYQAVMAVSGEGPRAYDWQDKPHRIVYDLCREVEAQADTITTLRAEVVTFQRSTIEWHDKTKTTEAERDAARARAEKAEAAADSLSEALKTAKSHLRTLGGDHRGRLALIPSNARFWMRSMRPSPLSQRGGDMSKNHLEADTMLGNEEFKVGQRVRPSPYGVECNIFSGTYRGERRSEWSGIIIKVSEFNSPTVKWDAIKTQMSYAPWFITSDHRRRAKNREAKP